MTDAHTAFWSNVLKFRRAALSLRASIKTQEDARHVGSALGLWAVRQADPPDPWTSAAVQLKVLKHALSAELFIEARRAFKSTVFGWAYGGEPQLESRTP